MIETRVVSLLRVMSCDTVAGTMRRRPCGRITNRICWKYVRPSDAAASRWPRSSDWIPERMISQRTAEL